LGKFLHCLSDLCDPDSNPKGHVPLCVAENKLVLDLLAERFVNGSANGFSDSSVYTYSNFLGMPVAREAAAYFFARRFLFPENKELSPEEALQHVQPKHVALAAGCAALINHLFFLLGTKGDCCLIPRPYYAAFENDMNIVAGIEPWGVSQAHPMLGPTVEEFQRAYDQARKKGFRPKFVLLTNPNNPLGVVYSPNVIKNAVAWARERDMHTIVDEIYALSTQKQGDFQSVIKVLDNDLRDDVHMLWALSKDFGASGLRCGLVYSQNEILLEGMSTMAIFTCVAGPIQYLMAELLTDDTYVDKFLDDSRLRLRHSYELCTRKLEEMVLPYCPAQAGLFIYVDFSSLLPKKTFQYEAELVELMFQYARVVLTPGESQRDESPGMFRIC
jgi:aspartate/methionine/tyrosine aminotransferase